MCGGMVSKFVDRCRHPVTLAGEACRFPPSFMSAPGRHAGASGASTGLSIAHKLSVGATGGRDFSHSSVTCRRSLAVQVALTPHFFWVA
jgi:hypothetical protein